MAKEKNKKKNKDQTLAGPGKEPLAIVWKSPSELIPYTRNAKLHPLSQIEGLASQIKEFGFDQPLVILPNNTIIKGHGRREAAMLLGLTKIPCIVSPLDEAKAILARIGDNKISETGWNMDFLRDDFILLQKFNADLTMTGFNVSDADSILNGWKSNIEAVPGTTGNTDGIRGTIKIFVPSADLEAVRTWLMEKLKELAIEGIEID